MNSLERDDARRKYGETPISDKEAYLGGQKIAQDLLEITDADKLEKRYGRIKNFARTGALILGSMQVIGDAANRVSEWFNREIQEPTPNTIYYAIGAYAVSRLCRSAQNEQAQKATALRDAFIETHGDMGLGAVVESVGHYYAHTIESLVSTPPDTNHMQSERANS